MKSGKIIIDTGPLVAYLNLYDTYHENVLPVYKQFEAPFYTCEAVLTEVLFLLKHNTLIIDKIFPLIEKEILIIENFNRNDLNNISQKMKKYTNVPMSFADACLVRMSENNPSARIFTLDSDFKIYKKSNNRVIPVVIPGLVEKCFVKNNITR